MKRLLLTVSLLLAFSLSSWFSLSSTAGTVDSLYQVLTRTTHADYTTANRLMIALDAEGMLDTLITFTRQDSRSSIMKTVCVNMAIHYDAAYQYLRAANAFTEAARHAKEDDDLAAEGDALSQAAVELHHLGEFDKAIRYTQQALHIDSVTQNTNLLSNDLGLMAAIFLSSGQPDAAVTYILKAIDVEKKREQPTRLQVHYGHAAEIYNKQGNTEEALHYAELAYEIDRKAGNAKGTARRMSQMADIYVARGDYRQAESCYLRAISQLEQLNEKHSLTIDYKQLGAMYLKQGRHQEAIGWLLKADTLSAQTGNNYLRSQIVRSLATCYEKTGRHDKACQYLQEAMTLNDTIHNQRLEQLTSEYKTRMELEQHQEELQERDSTIHSQRLLLTAVAVVAVALAIVLLAVLIKRRKKTGSQDASANADTDLNAPLPVTHHPSPLNGMQATDRQFLLDTVDFVHNNMKVRKVTVDMIAAELCMSRSQFCRRIQALTNESPNAYITRIRMEKAQRMLKDSNMPIKEIAYECGFDEANYFIRVFHQLYGMTPKQYRNTPMKTDL